MVVLFWAVGLVIIGLAIPLLRRRVKPNMLYGLRVPETLADEEIWYEANARSARDLLRLGVGTIVVATALWPLPWANSGHYALVCVVLLLVGVVGCAVRGLRIARAVTRELRGDAG